LSSKRHFGSANEKGEAMTRKLVLGVCLSIAAVTLSAPTAFADSPLSPALQHSPAPEQVSTFAKPDAVGYFRTLAAREPTGTTAFDWGVAATGALSAAMITLLLGGTLVIVRHARRRPLVR